MGGFFVIGLGFIVKGINFFFINNVGEVVLCEVDSCGVLL